MKSADTRTYRAQRRTSTQFKNVCDDCDSPEATFRFNDDLRMSPYLRPDRSRPGKSEQTSGPLILCRPPVEGVLACMIRILTYLDKINEMYVFMINYTFLYLNLSSIIAHINLTLEFPKQD